MIIITRSNPKSLGLHILLLGQVLPLLPCVALLLQHLLQHIHSISIIFTAVITACLQHIYYIYSSYYSIYTAYLLH